MTSLHLSALLALLAPALPLVPVTAAVLLERVLAPGDRPRFPRLGRHFDRIVNLLCLGGCVAWLAAAGLFFVATL